MKLVGTGVVLRDKSRDSDEEDYFRWLNLEEWKYYDQADTPFTGISREEFTKKRLEERQRDPSPTSRGWHIDTTEGRHLGVVSYYDLDERIEFSISREDWPAEEVS